MTKKFCKPPVRYFVMAMWIFGVTFGVPISAFDRQASATGCVDVKIIFARGSGEERWAGQNYQALKKELEEKLVLTNLSYEFEDLDYPAIGVGEPLTLLTTFISGGEAYNFGASIDVGIKKLTSEITNLSCPNTRYVIGGYSQGAMLVSKTLPRLDTNKIIYAATFGDPKLYLPEGFGLIPPACNGKNLSNYRIYVPDCQAYSGLLGGYKPYQPDNYVDKLGTWCNKGDIFCSSYLSIKDHTSYVTDKIYADASKHIFNKITKAFNMKNNYISLHDTVILIDSTASMEELIFQYKSEALRLASQTLENNGRVALYDYRDMADGYEPAEHCNFETCTIENFKRGLDEIEVDGGGDAPESLLSASLKVMKKLNWQYGSTKSIVILTDAGYHNPDIDGTTFADVVRLSKKIDPVNFYIITPYYVLDDYQDLAEATDGEATELSHNLPSLTDKIISRYDSLPRVEEASETEVLPEINDAKWKEISSGRVHLSWQNTGVQTIIALNDLPLGVTESNEITLEDLDLSGENIITLVPLSETRRGASLNLVISGSAEYGEITIPGAPDTGKF